MVIVHNKHILVIGMHGFDVLDLLEKFLFPQFTLESMLIHQMGQTWIFMIIYIFFVIGQINMFFSLVF